MPPSSPASFVGRTSRDLARLIETLNLPDDVSPIVDINPVNLL